MFSLTSETQFIQIQIIFAAIVYLGVRAESC